MTERIEFGMPRTSCSCRECRRNCLYMPGFLIPTDLDRMIPQDVDPFEWADINLLASPGAIVIRAGQLARIPTLVPATKPDGSCIHYRQHRCQIHDTSPFGCAFFDCSGDPAQEQLSHIGIRAVCVSLDSLYARIWLHLWNAGRRQDGPEVIRERMGEL